MAVRLSGMVSGLDTDALIQELVSAYSKKKDKYVKEQKSLEYKQDAWKSLNTKIYSFYSGKLSSMRFSSGYLSKMATVSDSTKATVTASNTAVNGVQTLQVKKLAKTGYLTGARLDSSVKGASKLSDLGITDSRVSVTAGGKDTYIDVNGDMTVNEFVVKLKEAGVNASYDETNGRFFVSSTTSGLNGDFSIAGNDAAGADTLKKLGLYTVSAADAKSYRSYIEAAEADSEYINNLAKNEYLNGLLNDEIAAINKETAGLKENSQKLVAQMKFAALTDKMKDEQLEAMDKSIAELEEWLNSEAANTVSEDVLKSRQEQLASMKETRADYEDIKTRVGSFDDEDFAEKLKEFTDEKDALVKANDEAVKLNDKEIEDIKKIRDGEIQGKEEHLSAAVDYSGERYNAILDKYNNRLTYAREVTAKYDAYQQAIKDDNKALIEQYGQELGLTSSDTGAVRIEGSDSEIYLNGAKFESTTNSLNINGLTITATALTAEGETITVTTSDDIDAMYKKVKDFFTEYNALIKEMDSLYNAESAGSYEPLTEEEEAEMTDKQVEKWEEKVKSASLRRDGTLNGVISAMKMAMASSITVNGRSLSLSSFGIKTLGYFASGENEKGMYHIDGDKEDSSVSANTDKLREALANNPEEFMSFFSQLTQNVYKSLSNKMAASTVSSAYTVYNDKSMKQQYNDYNKTIKDWEDKVDSMTEKYVQQFAAMEKALAQLQSGQSQLSSLLGGK